MAMPHGKFIALLLLAAPFFLGVPALAADVAPKGKVSLERLQQERAYQRELAKKKEAEAKERAAFVAQLRDLGAEEKFRRWIERAEALLAKADFQASIRAWIHARAVKPTATVLGEREQQLEAALQAQNRAVEFTLTSDGLTWVSVRNVQPPAQFTTAPAKLWPGNYELVGSREGYRDVVVPLKLRAGESPPAVKVVCAQRK